ncbi:hypothetical protein [Streptomyces sp. CBMA29]|uniref:hypothetical protein n=1 Tax=Streptomyces sp. CBMA29 TaxID=1896314 RepID=UPI001CB73470|nr:hypothetical protein [Streptomyces sp. CBMA29]MBD0739153.1 hypothetical protein [Streptomyces sp. CBMA29]
MTRVRARGRRAALVLPPSLTVVAALALAGCGTRTVDSTGAEAPSGRPAVAATSASASASPTDALCPGETPSPTPMAPAVTENPENGHYAENHGFMAPLPLHGQRRCDGLTEVRRVTAALEPLREKGDLSADHVRAGLVALGYAPDSISVSAYGSTYVGFVVDHTPICLKGALNTAVTEIDAFAGYPDGAGCQQPKGGH